MKIIIITRELSDLQESWMIRYNYDGWANPAGEVYDLRNGEYLALVNSASTGYTRKVFKTASASWKWVEKKLSERFHTSDIEFKTIL